MTFSISARCESTGMFGIAVSSSSPAVATRCAHARAGVGVVATQNITDPTLGPRALDLLERGASARQALDILLTARPHMAYRQVAIVDLHGRVAGHSGEHTLGVHVIESWEGGPEGACIAAGNLLTDAEVPRAMVDAFRSYRGPLAERLLAAMTAAIRSGGEVGPIHSAGLLIVREVPWPVADLRVDWDLDPIGALHRLWDIYGPQLEDYVTRALDPASAPKYGVPGEK